MLLIWIIMIWCNVDDRLSNVRLSLSSTLDAVKLMHIWIENLLFCKKSFMARQWEFLCACVRTNRTYEDYSMIEYVLKWAFTPSLRCWMLRCFSITRIMSYSLQHLNPCLITKQHIKSWYCYCFFYCFFIYHKWNNPYKQCSQNRYHGWAIFVNGFSGCSRSDSITPGILLYWSCISKKT